MRPSACRGSKASTPTYRAALMKSAVLLPHTTLRVAKVKTGRARASRSRPGLSMGIFSGRLQYTVYRGTNLIRQEAIAKTDEPSVAYKYRAGLKGFSTEGSRVRWRDTSRAWQKYEFGGTVNGKVPCFAGAQSPRLIETPNGTLAFSRRHTSFLGARDRVESRLRLVPHGRRGFVLGRCSPRRLRRDVPTLRRLG